MEDWIKLIIAAFLGGAGIKWVFDYFFMSRKDQADSAIKISASLTEQVTMLWGKVGDLEGQVNTWKEKYSTLQIEHERLQKDYESLKREHTKLKLEFDKLKKDNT